MTLNVLKEKLHDYIEHAAEKDLQRIYKLTEHENDSEYDDNTFAMLVERRDARRRGDMKSFTIEEADNYINGKIAQRGL